MSNSHPSCVEQGPPRAMHSLAWLVATKFQNVSGVSLRPSSKNTKSTSCFVVNAGLVHILNAQKALSIHKPLPKLGVNQSLPGLYLPLCIIFKTMSRMPYVPCGNCSPFICITRQNVVTLPKRLCLVSCTVRAGFEKVPVPEIGVDACHFQSCRHLLCFGGSGTQSRTGNVLGTTEPPVRFGGFPGSVRYWGCLVGVFRVENASDGQTTSIFLHSQNQKHTARKKSTAV